jgi:hypothetical protein
METELHTNQAVAQITPCPRDKGKQSSVLLLHRIEYGWRWLFVVVVASESVAQVDNMVMLGLSGPCF